MDKRQYCVYNQASECFLSLGVILFESIFERLKGMRRRVGQRIDEGVWITRPKGIYTVDLHSSRDLIYLDSAHKVLRVIESFPSFRLAPHCQGATSILSLPVRTIHASQTQPGHQLLICVAEEMELQLRNKTRQVSTASIYASSTATKGWLHSGAPRERRGAVRKRLPRLVAYDEADGTLTVHGIRDISNSGLYVITKQRWPLGSHVRMNIQPIDAVDDGANMPISMGLRVVRWGADGIGLEFLPTEIEQTALMYMDTR